MISASLTYHLFRSNNAIFLLLLTLNILIGQTAAASATGQQSPTSHTAKPQADPQRQHHHPHLQSNIIPVKHLSFHSPHTDGPNDGTTKNEFDRLNNRRYYGGRVTRAQVHEAVVKTVKHSHTNEIYVMGVASLN